MLSMDWFTHTLHMLNQTSEVEMLCRKKEKNRFDCFQSCRQSKFIVLYLWGKILVRGQQTFSINCTQVWIIAKLIKIKIRFLYFFDVLNFIRKLPFKLKSHKHKNVSKFKAMISLCSRRFKSQIFEGTDQVFWKKPTTYKHTFLNFFNLIECHNRHKTSLIASLISYLDSIFFSKLIGRQHFSQSNLHKKNISQLSALLNFRTNLMLLEVPRDLRRSILT